MSSGTRVTVTRYYNHHHYHSLEEIDEIIVETKEQVSETWGEIFALCASTPNDIIPLGKGIIPLEFVKKRLDELREYLNYLNDKLDALFDIKDGWETREED